MYLVELTSSRANCPIELLFGRVKCPMKLSSVHKVHIEDDLSGTRHGIRAHVIYEN